MIRRLICAVVGHKPTPFPSKGIKLYQRERSWFVQVYRFGLGTEKLFVCKRCFEHYVDYLEEKK